MPVSLSESNYINEIHSLVYINYIVQKEKEDRKWFNFSTCTCCTFTSLVTKYLTKQTFKSIFHCIKLYC